MLPVTIKGNIKKKVSMAVADKLVLQIQSCLLAKGMQIYENDERTVKFKPPFLLWWGPNTSLLFLISNAELRIEQEDESIHFVYKIRFSRVIYSFLVMVLVGLFIWGEWPGDLLTVLAIGIVVLTPLIVMSTIAFKSFIGECLEDCGNQQKEKPVKPA